MSQRLSRRLIIGASALAALGRPIMAQSRPAMQAVLDYAQS